MRLTWRELDTYVRTQLKENGSDANIVIDFIDIFRPSMAKITSGEIEVDIDTKDNRLTIMTVYPD